MLLDLAGSAQAHVLRVHTRSRTADEDGDGGKRDGGRLLHALDGARECGGLAVARAPCFDGEEEGVALFQVD